MQFCAPSNPSSPGNTHPASETTGALLVPLTAEPGTAALLTTPDALDGGGALNAESYPDWQREAAARSARRTGFYRPGRAPRGELVRLPGGHYPPFLGAHERAVQAELSFLRHNLLEA